LNPVVPQNYTNRGTTGDFAGRYERDVTAKDRIGLIVRHDLSRFQIPNEQIQQAAGQRQDGGNFETMGIASYQHVFSPDLLGSLHSMVRDNANDLTSNPESTPVIALLHNHFREAYFNGAGGCKSCHSVTGDLAHIGTKYQPDQLQTRFVWPGPGGFGGGGRGAARPQKVTVTLPNGQVIPGTVKQMDDINISIYDASGSYRSWPREGLKVEVEDRLAGHRQLLDKYTDADMHNLTAYLVTLK
jgi:hypothetical protein